MKRNYNISFFILIIVFLAASCELFDETGPGGGTISKIEGLWKCEENSQKFKKSTMGTNNYEVYISPYPGDSTKVLLTGFYQLGDNIEAVAKLNGMTLTLSRQNLPGGFEIISGSGTISSTFKKITWSYKVDDGSGDVDNATATYTKLY